MNMSHSHSARNGNFVYCNWNQMGVSDDWFAGACVPCFHGNDENDLLLAISVKKSKWLIQ